MPNRTGMRSAALKGLFGFLCAATIMGAGVGARAGDSWYVAVGAGAAFLSESSSTASDAFGNSVSFDTDFDTGFGVTGAIGHSWGAFRLEGEVSYRENDLDTIELTNVTLAGIGSFNNVGSFAADGDVSALGFMANGWYDFDTGSPWKPFVGGGLGVARVSVNDAAILGITFADDDDWVFAYQLGAGIGYEVNPTTVVSLGYRFFGTADPDFTFIGGLPFDAEYHSHNVEIGVRFSF